MNQSHVYPLPFLLIKFNHDGKSDKTIVKIKLRRDPTLPTSDLYELKMSFFENGDPEEFFFVLNFNMTLAASGTLEAGAKYQYICTLVCGEALRQFDLLSAEV